MSSIVNGYMDAIERESDMFDRSMKIESNKISLMVEAYYNKLENDYLLAEQKVMMENGTYDDLTYLYMEANEESKQNKETIFQKIKAFFQRIFDSIKNLFRRGDAYEGDAPKCFMDAANGSGSSEIVNFFKKVGNDFKNGNVISAIETLGKGGLTAFSVCVAIDKGVESASNIIHYPKKAYLKVKDWFNRLTSELERIESELIAAAEASKNEKATGFANAVKAKLGKLILTVKGLWQKFVSFITDVKDKITGKNNEEGKDKEKKDEKGQSGEQGESNEQSGEQGESNEQSGEPEELTEESKKECNELGKQMKNLGKQIIDTIEMLVRQKKLTDDDVKDIRDAYAKIIDNDNKPTIQVCHGCLASMISVFENKAKDNPSLREYKNTYNQINEKYKKFDNKMHQYTFESYYYIMYNYEIITESDDCESIITGDSLIDDVLIALNEF